MSVPSSSQAHLYPLSQLTHGPNSGQTISGQNTVEQNVTYQTVHNNISSRMPTPVERPGLEKLLEKSMRDAFHDSAARAPHPRCLEGTRVQLLDMILHWALGDSDHAEWILWLHGPFGVGKTAVSQSTAVDLHSKNKLAASVFLSFPNQRNNPSRIFTSIAYQIAVKCDPFGDAINRRVLKDTSILTADLSIQFEELIAKPLREIDVDQASLDGWVIIIDGLDECSERDAQRELIRIIAKSVQDRTTLFRWFIISRPELHIVNTMNLTAVSPLLFRVELTLSDDTEPDIVLYLTIELGRVGANHGIPSPWPTDTEITGLTKRAARLFIYAATAVRFIDGEDLLDPRDQLQAVLQLTENTSPAANGINPFHEIDTLYTLILQRLPPITRETILKILLLHSHGPLQFDHMFLFCNTLNLSEAQLRRACGSLQSVLIIRGATGIETLRFYHASFMEFLQDEKRSKELCIYGNPLTLLRRQLLDRINTIHSRSTDRLLVMDSPSHVLSSHDAAETDNTTYYNILASLLNCLMLPHPIGHSTVISLLQVQFRMIPYLLDGEEWSLALRPRHIKDNLPVDYRNKVIRRSKSLVHLVRKPKWARFQFPWILGEGKNCLVCWRKNDAIVYLVH